MKTETGTPRPPLSFTLYHSWADYRSRLSWSWFFESFSSLTLVLVLGALSYTLITQFVFEALTVSGTSMYPTLFDKGNYWLNRFVYLHQEPQRTDIVALKDPQDGVLVVKRIIAMPGESIYLNQGKVYVNGKLFSEPYISKYMPTYAYEKSENEMFILGKNEYFVLGDNRGVSLDSRAFGPVPRENILGRVIQ